MSHNTQQRVVVLYNKTKDQRFSPRNNPRNLYLFYKTNLDFGTITEICLSYKTDLELFDCFG